MILTKHGPKYSWEELQQAAQHMRLMKNADLIRKLEQEAKQPSGYLMQPTRTVEQVLEERK